MSWCASWNLAFGFDRKGGWMVVLVIPNLFAHFCIRIFQASSRS